MSASRASAVHARGPREIIGFARPSYVAVTPSATSPHRDSRAGETKCLDSFVGRANGHCRERCDTGWKARGASIALPECGARDAPVARSRSTRPDPKPRLRGPVNERDPDPVLARRVRHSPHAADVRTPRRASKRTPGRRPDPAPLRFSRGSSPARPPPRPSWCWRRCTPRPRHRPERSPDWELPPRPRRSSRSTPAARHRADCTGMP